MAIFFDAPVSPDALTTFVREVPVPQNLALTNLFGAPRLQQSNTIDFAEIVRTNRTARYRSYDGRIHVSERDVGTEKRVKLAPLSSSLGMGELERLQLQFAQTGGTNQQALAGAVYNDAENLTREVQNRMEQAWGQVLSTGKLVINENGFNPSEADYGMPANQNVAPTVLWSDKTNAKALTDLTTWNDLYVANNGTGIGSVLTSLRVQRLAQSNKEVIDAVYGSTQGRTRVSNADLNNLLAGEGLPTFNAAYDAQVDVDGVSTRVIADDKVVFLPQNPADLGFTAYGISATALELVTAAETDLTFENAPGIVGVVIKSGPPFRSFTYVDAVGQPILSNARLLMVADVA